MVFGLLLIMTASKVAENANVEVHGGATLEEVVVPIIEITKFAEDIEVSIIEKVITVSFRKKAAIRLFSKTKLQNVCGSY